MKVIIHFLCLVVVLCQSCGFGGNEQKSAGIAPANAYLDEISQWRRQKDNDFAVSLHSPFRDLNIEFSGLKYFPTDPNYRVKAWLDAVPNAVQQIKIPDSKGEIRHMVLDGQLFFQWGGRIYSLPALRTEEDEKHYFIMFRDKTSGIQTYGGGRYIDVDIAGDTVLLDFNKAYNPYCHYNHGYACPLVPKENTLEFSVEAGEKIY